MDLVNHLEGRLLFAVPKKGRLLQAALNLLEGADIQFRRESRLDIALVKNLPIALVFLPAADIPTFVGEGRVSIGITGRDTVAEHAALVESSRRERAESGKSTPIEDDGQMGCEEVMDLGFGSCKLQVQVPEKGQYVKSSDLIGKNIGTSFVHLAEDYFAALEAEAAVGETNGAKSGRKLKTKIIELSGSVEAACALGVADGIVDLVESGETMKAAGLKAIDTVVSSTAILVKSKNPSNPQLVELIASRIRGVITAQKYVLCQYNVQRMNLVAATKITPGRRAPTINALEEEGWVAVSSMVEKKRIATVMDDLTEIGAVDILRFPVCIVGAGPSGLTAAKRLEDKGRKVVIFEKQDSVGGKCQAVYETNTFHPLGALLFSNASYPETLKVIDVSGVPSVPFVTGQRWLYDVASGSTALSPAISSAFATLVGQEFQRYAVYWNTLFAPYSALRYKNGVPQELTVTTAQWLASNNYQALPVLFVQAMVAFGYGDLREVPILYMLQYLTPDILAFFARIHGVYLIDFHKVWVNWTKKSIKGPIYLRSTITKIDRSGPFPKITYQKAGNDKRTPRSRPEVQQCSSVILAFPPTVPALQAAKLNLTPDEITVFSPLTLISYFSGAVRLQTPRNLSFSAASPPNIPVAATGAPVSLLHLFNTSDIATTWSWGNNTSKAIARQLLKETLSKINKDPTDPAAVPVPVTDKDILGFQQNDYFPHFGPQELAAGWYDKFNKLQGVKNTYFASGLNGFETVEFALRAGSEIVETFF